MPKDTGELIFFKSINLCCQPIFSYISGFVIAPNAPFSQSLSHIIMNIILCKMNLTRGNHLVRFLANKFKVVKTTLSH